MILWYHHSKGRIKWTKIKVNHPGYQYTMVEGKIVVSGISRLRLKIRYPANNNFAKCQGISRTRKVQQIYALLVGCLALFASAFPNFWLLSRLNMIIETEYSIYTQAKDITTLCIIYGVTQSASARIRVLSSFGHYQHWNGLLKWSLLLLLRLELMTCVCIRPSRVRRIVSLIHTLNSFFSAWPVFLLHSSTITFNNYYWVLVFSK